MENHLCPECINCKVNIQRMTLCCSKGYWQSKPVFSIEVEGDGIQLRFRKDFIQGLRCPDFEGEE
jgi:hypothetical protein